MAIQISGNDVIDNNRKGIFQSANVGAFANPARPASASTGDVIYSTTDEELQVWDGTQWIRASKGKEIVASGGTITTLNGVRTHTFTSPGTFTITSAPPTAIISYVVVAGGGGGGIGQNPGPTSSDGGGGGGGGGVLRGTTTASPGNYPVSVGAGGAGGYRIPGPTWFLATSGSPSTFDTFTATGGGYGGNIGPGAPPPQNTGGPGGSGGARNGSGIGGQGFPGSGGNNINGGAGGGAGAAGDFESYPADRIAVRGSAISLGPTLIPTGNYASGGASELGVMGGGIPSGGANTGTGGDGRVIPNSGFNGDSGVVIVSYSVVQQ